MNESFALRHMQVFNFGTVVADLADAGTATGSAPGAEPGRAVTANIKLTNAAKVPCVVKCTVEPLSKPGAAGSGAAASTAAAAAAAAATQATFPLSCSPGQLTIAPHADAFVQLQFHPKQIASFVGVFKATAENGEQQRETHQFKCELRVCF